ncbi:MULTISPECIES: efflux RND transporter periplasmic adaptor subunit [unclassified Sphingopyxis]|uniref:efflux RND transporter periplasmic adaptor subunit n=1 Tax=unclassified Sphingopyxis TaxID=2614943 RepID=UPI002855BAA8|nr:MULTISPECIES: efflux RND transporter periplasmic adaptor subunit [unclassified Sphingopyxis]MDR7060316.1 Cu(I)/Ag(I) efflux system membrane fusion protein [Sphingopyxis sp. BE235]MDR7180171.1 Cu(I)/Ag(I) efflux system membrane fusion protein [Sphingopyxis sp. BE249]
MTDATSAARWRAGILAAVLIAGGGGYWLGLSGQSDAPTEATGSGGRKILYYYDPMFPNQKFDKPGKSPFMDMQLEPKYADEGSGAAPGVSVDPAARQSLGIRVVAAEMGSIAATFDVNGSIDFNQRDVAIVQARSGGFVERVYRLAPGDVIGAGAPIADLQLPEWGSAQTEYLSVKKLRKPELTAAARQRLRLMGIPEGVIAEVDRTGRTGGRLTVRAPIGGVVQTLNARVGVTLATGQTLAEISGLGTVWLNAALPEAQAALVKTGQRATATLTAYPGESFAGRVIAILPTASADSRTLTARVELANRGGRLRPGMFATVALGSDAKPALLVPSEAVIRTGTRNIVMLEKGDGRYHPAEVVAGREGGGKTEILQGLAPGEKVVASGQFLLDSEASLTGLTVRSLESAQ